MLKPKMWIFDCDGVLSIPSYESDTSFRRCVGFPQDVWKEKVLWDNNLYRYCTAPDVFVDLISELVSTKKDFYCVTVCENSFEYNNKVKFLIERYGDAFNYSNVIFVSNKAEKINIMKALQAQRAYKCSEVVLVEDDYETCINANNDGFTALHVSSFLNGRPIL